MQSIIKIEKLSKVYASGFKALNNINLEIREGEIIALLGPNGAGKTTLISIICGIVTATSGTVTIGGYDIVKDYRAARSLIGLVPQELATDAFETVSATMRLSRGIFGKKPDEAFVQGVLKSLSLDDKKNEKIMALSGGMKRRLLIARALVHEPRLLILDEPTAGVDIELRRSTWEFLQQINKAGTTIILTTHYLEEAETLCRNIAMIDKGEIIVNTTMKQLLQTLNQEIFVLDTHTHMAATPELPGFDVRLVDETTLEVGLQRQQNLNDVFALLSAAQISVKSMRNKSNRLEQLFVSLLKDSQAGKGGTH
ncbi:MAG: ABC transporter ATP-binding protein [Burkholderiales bacterium]